MKVALLGTAPGSRLIAPYEDESYEIWACSAGNSQGSAVPRVTKWFELHAIVDMVGAENKAWSLPYFAWLRAQSFPIYMQEKNDLIPQAIIFPYKKLCERFGPNPQKGLTNWFTSSIAWMIAYAITMMGEGDEIAIFGVDMAAAEEAYTAQKAGIHRMIEYARAAGIKVTIPYESCLGQHLPLYGYSEATPMGRKWQVRLHELTQARQQIDTQLQNLLQQRAYFDGALEGIKYDIRTWANGMDATLETDGQEGGSEIENQQEFINTMKQRAEAQFGTPAPLTAEFTENDNGVFVPAAKPAKKKKNYTMDAEPGKFTSAGMNGGGEKVEG